MAMQEIHEGYTKDNLFAATQMMPIVADKLTVAKGGVFTRGALLSSTGVAATTTDVYAVLAEDVDATDAAKDVAVYLTGEFNSKAVVVTGDVADFIIPARKVGIFLKANIEA